MIQLATIGTSWITDQFIEAVQEGGRYSLRAVYSRSKEKAREKVGMYGGDYATDDLEELWRDEQLDLVYIASPNSLHFEQALRAIKARKHLIIEKPIFSNTKEWDEAFNLAEEYGVYIFEAARHIHTRNYRHLKSLIEFKQKTKKYPFLGANLNIGQYSSKYDQYNEAVKNNKPVPNVFNPEFSGGVLMDMGVYPIYAAVDLFGKPEAVEYKATKGPNGADLYGHIYFEYESFTVAIFISKGVHSTLQNEFYFDNETVRVPNITDINGVEIVTPKEGKVMQLDYPVTNPMSDEAEVFADILEEKDQVHYHELKQLSRDVIEVVENLKSDLFE